MDSKKNDLEPKPPEGEHDPPIVADKSDGATEAIRRQLDVLDVQDIPDTPVKQKTPLKEQFSDLNSKLITYVNEARKTELMLAESERNCKHLEEKLLNAKQEYRNQIEILRCQLDARIQESVLLEEQRQATEARFENCHKQLKLATSICETQKDRLDSLEQTLQTERQRLSAALEELVSLREQMVRERADSNHLKQQLTTLTIDHAKLKERSKINIAELSMYQSKLSEIQAKFQYTAEDVKERLAEQKARLDRQFQQQLVAKCQSHENELALMTRNIEEKLQRYRQTTGRTVDYDLLKSQLSEQQRRAEIAEAHVADLRQKLKKSEAEIQRINEDHTKRIEQERRRREKLNQRLLMQARSQEEIRLELENYRKLMENVDVDALHDSPTARCSPIRGSTYSSASFRLSSPDSSAERSKLLRRALGARKRSLSGGSDMLQKVANKRDESSFEH